METVFLIRAILPHRNNPGAQLSSAGLEKIAKHILAYYFFRLFCLTSKMFTQAVRITRLARVQVARYHEQVIDHYSNPRNVGKLNKNAADVGTGLVGAPACGMSFLYFV